MSQKLSQIADGGAVAGATDKIVTVRSGTTDFLTTPVALDLAQVWTAVQTFTNSLLKLLGSSTGATTLTSDNAGATNYTLHVPAANDTLAVIGAAQTLSNKTLASPIVTGAAPANAAAAGVAGTIVTDTGFIYVCTATNTWKRVAIATW